ncbi:hypothetical protein AB1N83_004159 [Pleurotus pulmonarius]
MFPVPLPGLATPSPWDKSKSFLSRLPPRQSAKNADKHWASSRVEGYCTRFWELTCAAVSYTTSRSRRQPYRALAIAPTH